MKTVVVIATGGTLASATDGAGAKSARLRVEDILSATAVPSGVEIRTVTPFTRNSYDLGFREMDLILDSVHNALSDPSVAGIVVTHGTDTLEETAMLLAVTISDPRPIVLTGAQRSADVHGGDGPANLRDAIIVASADSARSRGTLIVFGGVIHSAEGTRKVHNTSLNAFRDIDRGPLGSLEKKTLSWDSATTHRRSMDRLIDSCVRLGNTQVDIVALYPGASCVVIEALIRAGAVGIVLQGTGYGNANSHIVEAVRHHTRQGIIFVMSSRVAGGEIRAVYGGGGGGADLVQAGAIPSGLLRPSQARILLALSIASGMHRQQINQYFHPA